MPSPVVSVVIGQHRPRGYLISAVESVLDRQGGGASTEVIVTLGSPDPRFESWSLAHPDVTVLAEPAEVLGHMLARAVSRARGEIICFLDDDDRFLPGKLHRLREVFAADPTLSFFHHEASFIDSEGRSISASWMRPMVQRRMRPGSTVYLPADRKLAWSGRLAHVGPDFNSSCIAVRRRSIVPFIGDLDRLEAGPDAFLFFVVGLLSDGSIRCDGDRWTEYRLHSSVTRPEDTTGDPRESLQRANLVLAEGQSALVDMVRPRENPGVTRLTEACVESHRFFAQLRSPAPTRSGWATAFLRALRYWDTFVMRANWLALAGSIGSLLAPRQTQAIYLHQVRPQGPPLEGRAMA